MFLANVSHLLADDDLPAEPYSPEPVPPEVVKRGHCRHCGKKIGAKRFLISHEKLCEVRL